MRKIVILAALAVLLRCGGDETPAPPAPPPQKPELLHAKGPDDSDDRNNLLNFAHGAVVVSRTGEVSLQNSAQNAIDGDPSTAWLSPPDETDQSIVVALPGRARIRSVGLLIGEEVYVHPKSVEFELSTDGKTFKPAASFEVPPSGRNIVDITPADATFVRFKTHGGQQFVRAMSLFARGEFAAAARPGSLAGCWSINGADAAFTQSGAQVTGHRGTMAFDGGSDGRFYRLLWLRGAEYGIAGVAVTPDSQHLSGTFWHEESYNRFIGEAWFGEKGPCGPDVPQSDINVLAVSMQRFGRYTMYGLQFDDGGHLIEAASAATLDRVAAFLKRTNDIEIVAHELLQPDKARNQSVSQTKIDTLRDALGRRSVNVAGVQFVAVGSDDPHRPASTDAARSVYGAVELVRKGR